MIKYHNSKIDEALSHIEDAISSLRAGVSLLAEWDEVTPTDEQKKIPVYSSLDALVDELLHRKETNFAPESLPSARQ